ncbi:uncharacterized protein [Procambarus clarkii]|uniref:uncharacterized protein n=1 Tax=Procambarus clarkii TaxID=6728 RepID=UPI003742B941
MTCSTRGYPARQVNSNPTEFTLSTAGRWPLITKAPRQHQAGTAGWVETPTPPAGENCNLPKLPEWSDDTSSPYGSSDMYESASVQRHCSKGQSDPRNWSRTTALQQPNINFNQ